MRPFDNGRKFGQDFANQIRRRPPRTGDKWHLDEIVIKIAGVKHLLWRAVDQTGMVLDVLVQSRRDKAATNRLLRKSLKRQCRAENSHQPTRRRERQMKRFKSAGQAQRFLSAHGGINNLFHLRHGHVTAGECRAARGRAFAMWAEISRVAAAA
jgi:putative transposase